MYEKSRVQCQSHAQCIQQCLFAHVFNINITSCELFNGKIKEFLQHMTQHELHMYNTKQERILRTNSDTPLMQLLENPVIQSGKWACFLAGHLPSHCRAASSRILEGKTSFINT
jgi:hypothetical protein